MNEVAVFVSVTDRLKLIKYEFISKIKSKPILFTFVKDFVRNRLFVHQNCRDCIKHLQWYSVRCTHEMYSKGYQHVYPMLLNALPTILVQLDQMPLIRASIATIVLNHFES